MFHSEFSNFHSPGISKFQIPGNLKIAVFDIRKFKENKNLKILSEKSTVLARMVDTPRFLDLRFGLYSPNHQVHENKQYTIEKPFKIATRNAKKKFEFSKICKIFRAFFEKAVFLENGRGRH